jgi:pimeloyl-ACP methyl ester carboxylesterase
VILEHGLGYGVNSGSWATVEAGVAKTTRVCRYDRAFVGHSDDAKSGRSMPDLAADLRALLKGAGLPGPYVLVGHSFGGLTVRFYALLHPGDVAGMVLVDGSPPSAITNLDLSSERLNRPKVLAQLKLLKSLGSIPLVVITRGIGLSPSWRDAQVAMAHLSTIGRQVIATRSDHWIQLRQPDLVIRQVNDVIAAVRRRI